MVVVFFCGFIFLLCIFLLLGILSVSGMYSMVPILDLNNSRSCGFLGWGVFTV